MRPYWRQASSCQAASRQCTAHISGTSSLRSMRANGSSFILIQRRGITQQYILRMREAHESWKSKARRIKNGEEQSFLEMLESRGLVKNVVGDRDTLNRILIEKRVGFYVGVDPTAPSLHVGHMLPMMILGWAYVYGFKAVYLLGGSTAQIGDPTGRLTARDKLANATRKANILNMHMQLKRLGVSFEKYGERFGYEYSWAFRRQLENNNTWWNKQPFLEVMKYLGEYVRLGPMLGRDNVKIRLEKQGGMSFAEFSYPLMQAWDWWQLFKRDVQVQVGGSDQEGNILFGAETIKQMVKNGHLEGTESDSQRAWKKQLAGKEELPHPSLNQPMGITTPLLTTSSGQKFGKSAGNAIWLDKDMTSTFDLYQFFVRTSDADVEQYLKMFTFIPLPEISEIMKEQRQDPSKRVAQHRLAFEFTTIAHGLVEAQQAQKQHLSIFGDKIKPDESSRPSGEASDQVNAANAPSYQVILPRSLVYGQYFHKLMWSAGLTSSKAEAYRLIRNNGAAVGCKADARQSMGDAVSYTPIRPWEPDVTEKFIIDDSFIILRVGKWKIKFVKIISDEEFEARGLTAPGWKEQETEEEKKADADLVNQRIRIAGRRVRRPAIAGEKEGPEEPEEPEEPER